MIHSGAFHNYILHTASAHNTVEKPLVFRFS
nr:MAG TPA: hypothetical protein [Caudoviricetes sp.]